MLEDQHNQTAECQICFILQNANSFFLCLPLGKNAGKKRNYIVDICSNQRLKTVKKTPTQTVHSQNAQEKN